VTTATIHIFDRMPSAALRRFAWGVLGFFVVTILWGAVVRATGSGATLFLTVTEGALGAVLVKFGLTAESRSPMRAPVEALHLSNTLLLLAALAMTAHFLGRRIGYRWRDVRISAPIGTTAGMVAIMIVGVTGSLAALGDTLFPASSLGNAMQQDFAGHLTGESTWLLRWRWTHPTVAILASIFLIWLLIRAARRGGPWDNRKLSALVVGLLVVQYVLGALDVWLLAPVWMQVVHLLGADALWTALVVLTARLALVPTLPKA